MDFGLWEGGRVGPVPSAIIPTPIRSGIKPTPANRRPMTTAPQPCTGTVVRPSKLRSRRLVVSPMVFDKVATSARLKIDPEVTRREHNDVGQHVCEHRRLQPPLPVEVARDQTED